MLLVLYLISYQDTKIEQQNLSGKMFCNKTLPMEVGGCVNCQAAPTVSATYRNDVVEHILIHQFVNIAHA